MSAISSLPVEIWESILRRAIAVPGFLDADPGEDELVETLYKDVSSPMANEIPYWNAERVRNRLQRVSKSWDGHLRRFEHRYIRFLDIRSGMVEPQKLKKAVRISLGRCDRFCREYSHMGESFGGFCQQTLTEVDSLDAEIVDMQCDVNSILTPGSYSKLAHVKTLFAYRCDHHPPLVQLIGSLPNLRHAYTDALHARRGENSPTPCLASQSLHTLTIRISLRARSSMLTLELPSLRHLLIICPTFRYVRDFGKASISTILRAVGGQLRSLHLYYQPEPNETLGEVWELCPKLEVLYTSFPLASSPPPFHPIHTLVVNHKYQLQELAPLPEWPNLRRVVVLHPGEFADQDDLGTLAVTSRESMRLEDANGFTLEYGA